MTEGRQLKTKNKRNKGLFILWKQFAENTTAHGFNQIKINSHIAGKALWVLIIIACQFSLYFQIAPLVGNYLRRPVKTKITLEERKFQVFPVVTFCGPNIIKASKLKQLLTDMLIHENKYEQRNRERRSTENKSGNGKIHTRISIYMRLKKLWRSMDKKYRKCKVKYGLHYRKQCKKYKYRLRKKIKDNEEVEKAPDAIDDQFFIIENIEDLDEYFISGGDFSLEDIQGNMTNFEGLNLTDVEHNNMTDPKDQDNVGDSEGCLHDNCNPIGQSEGYTGWMDMDRVPDEEDSEFKVDKEDVKKLNERVKVVNDLSKVALATPSKVFQYGHGLFEMLKDCKWKEIYNCRDPKWWKELWHWRYGSCFAFNTGDAKTSRLHKVRKTGPGSGLVLTLASNQSEYTNLTDTAGMILHIGEQGARIEPYINGYSLAPDFAHSIQLTKTRIHRVDPFRNNSCTKNKKTKLGQRFPGQEVITKYSVHVCKEVCTAKEQISRCGCTESWLPSLDNNNTCGKEHFFCLKNISLAVRQDALPCFKTCTLPCDEVKYNVENSARVLSELYRKKAKHAADEDLRVSITFKTLETQLILNEEYYFLQNLFADIGGQLGLWSGISVLTVIEIAYFIGYCFYFLIGHNCNEKTDENDASQESQQELNPLKI